jgi:hypothetical protein
LPRFATPTITSNSLCAHIGNQSLFMARIFVERIHSRAERRGFPDVKYYEELDRANFRIASDRRLGRRTKPTSMVTRRFSNRNNVERADRVRNPLLVDDHDRFRMEGDEVLMRHADFPATGKLQRERMKAVLQPTPDLFDDHGVRLASRPSTAILLTTSTPHPSQPLRWRW